MPAARNNSPWVIEGGDVVVLRLLGPQAPIDSLPLSRELGAALAVMDIATLEEVAALSRGAFLKRREFNRMMIRELVEALAVQRMAFLGEDVPEPPPEQTRSPIEPRELEVALRELVAIGEPSERHRETLVALLGWDGRGTRTLHDIAVEQGITRERVRQVRLRVMRRIKAEAPYVPAVEEALAVVDASQPARATWVEQQLVDEGYAREPFRLEGLITAAATLRLHPRFSLVHDLGVRWVVSPWTARLVRDVCKAANSVQTGRAHGTLAELHERMKVDEDQSLALVCREVIHCAPDLHWLDERAGVFASTAAAERLVARIRKMMAVSNVLSLEQVRDGLARDGRLDTTFLSNTAVAGVCRLMPDVDLRGQLVHRKGPPPVYALSKAERALVELFRESGPVLRRAEVIAGLVDRDVSRFTAASLLRSPIVARVGPDAHALRGAATPEALVTRRTSKKTKPRHALEVLKRCGDLTLEELVSLDGRVGKWAKRATLRDLVDVAAEAGAGRTSGADSDD